MSSEAAALIPERTSAGSFNRWEISPGCALNNARSALRPRRGPSRSSPSSLRARLSRERTLESTSLTSAAEARRRRAQAFCAVNGLPPWAPRLRRCSTAARSTSQRFPTFLAGSWPCAAMALTRVGLSLRLFAASPIERGSTIDITISNTQWMPQLRRYRNRYVNKGFQQSRSARSDSLSKTGDRAGGRGRAGCNRRPHKGCGGAGRSGPGLEENPDRSALYF